MIFAIEEINRDSTLLPSVILGYRIFDNCGSAALTVRAALALGGGQEEDGAKSTCRNPVPAVLTSNSVFAARRIGPFGLPLVTEQLKRVNFVNRFGEAVYFDENGDPPAAYDIINWQLNKGVVSHVTVGHFDTSPDGGSQLVIDEDSIVWSTGREVLYKHFYTLFQVIGQ
uniref:Receptor ligand binding region domain-containing protein n=1 Tax=Lepisosteus oculatus TaxID=7918 RepID=W5M364_LEPOC